MQAYKPKDENPFLSETGRRLYDALLRRRSARADLSERITAYADEQRGPSEVVSREPLVPGPSAHRSSVYNAVSAVQPTLVELLEWYQHKECDAVIGQEKALIKMTLKSIMLNSFTLEGPAGRGKTHLLKALMSTLPGDMVYWFEFATDTTLFNMAEEVNRYKILVIPEYQKIIKSCPQTREAIKTITEGRIAKRQKMCDGEIKEYVLYPKCVITAIADENEFKEFLEKDKEDMRRFSHIILDSSFDSTQKIREFKSRNRSMRQELLRVAPESLGERIQRHLAACINLQFDSPPLDPFAEYMDQHLPITDKSIAYVDDYYSYLDGCAKFHHSQRVVPGPGSSNLILDLSDHYTIYDVYHDEFCKTLLKLDNLQDFGDRAQRACEPVDWKACFEAGISKMRENFPSVLVDRWISRQLRDNKLIVLNPLNHEEQVLFDYGPATQELVRAPVDKSAGA